MRDSRGAATTISCPRWSCASWTAPMCWECRTGNTCRRRCRFPCWFHVENAGKTWLHPEKLCLMEIKPSKNGSLTQSFIIMKEEYVQCKHIPMWPLKMNRSNTKQCFSGCIWYQEEVCGLFISRDITRYLCNLCTTRRSRLNGSCLVRQVMQVVNRKPQGAVGPSRGCL